MRTGVFQLTKYVSQSLYRDLLAESLMADAAILTESTAQRTAGEKYRAGTVRAADARLFAEV